MDNPALLRWSIVYTPATSVTKPLRIQRRIPLFPRQHPGNICCTQASIEIVIH